MGRKFLISAIILSALYGICYFGVPAVVNLPKRANLIEKAVFDETGYRISIKSPEMKMGIVPSVKISAESFEVLNNDNSEALKIKRPYINIKLLPLIFKHLDIKEISAENLTANLILDKNNKLKLGQYEINNTDVSFNLKHDKIKLENYNIIFDNKLISKQIEIKGTDLFSLHNGIEINDLKVSGEGINAYLYGKVTRLSNKFPNLDLKIAVTDTKAENIIPFLPDIPDLSPDMNLQLLKKTGFWGNASANIELKGKADFPEVYGNVLVSDAYLVKPVLNADKALIKLVFKGDKMNLDVKVPTSKTETVFVKGDINLDKERNADLHITSTNNVDLKTAQIVLNPLHEILYFDIGPVPVMDIRGKGGINLHVIGNRKNPHAWGQFWFNNATVSFIDINNMILTNGSGVLDFNNQDTVFKTKSGFLFGTPIKIDGTCSLEGKLNFNVDAKKQDLNRLLKIVQTSPMLADIQKFIEPIQAGSGLTDFYLNLTGQVKDVNNVVFNKNIFAKGKINLYSNQIKLKNLPAAFGNIKGFIDFDGLNAKFNLISYLSSSSLQINGFVKDDICNANVKSQKLSAADIFKVLNIKTPYMKDLATINTTFDAKYNGSIDNIDYNKIQLKGKILSNRNSNSEIKVDNANYELRNSNFKLPMFKGTFKKSPFNLNLYASDILTQKQLINGYFKINSFDLNLINDEAVQTFVPQTRQLKDFEFLNGKVNLSARIKNNNLNAYSVLDDINILYKPKKVKFLINSGNLLLRNNILNVNKITAQLGEMPVFIDGKILNVNKNPIFNLYINAKPTQDFFDQFYNNQTLYPIKLKGDVNLKSKLFGTAENLNAKSTLNIDEESNIYYMGATLGDKENSVKISVDNNFYPNKIKINSLQYDKIIESQNNKPYTNTQLTASGIINLLQNNNVGFNNLKIKTYTPTDAKIFNIIFRKPFMKQGVFSSDLVLNGTALNPVIKGKLDITSVDIPYLDSTVKEINLDFKNDKILISGKGTVLTNDILLNAVMKNRLQPPYIIEDLDLKFADLNINKVTDTLRDFEVEAARTPSISSGTSQNFDSSMLIINKADVEADKITVKNINADNFKASLNLDKNEQLNIDNFKFDIAEGTVLGGLKHNLKNHRTDLDIKLNNANALIMSEALFDLKGQVYGLVDGGFNLSCNGHSHNKCFETLNGSGTFKITDGRMPKLGSLEYLLKAGNLIKGGFTGLSINSIIDLITPLKTGNFESISGDINILNGVADKINVYSNGDDLNMYMTGSYNLVNSVADMKIYGTLSKNITTVFGKIKNASLNTLLNTIPKVSDTNVEFNDDVNKIPDINNATDIYRIFAVDINGDINGDNYVKSFKWIK